MLVGSNTWGRLPLCESLSAIMIPSQAETCSVVMTLCPCCGARQSQSTGTRSS
jgi:hypothetical protein